MSTAEKSAAERAEARRLKILAKKQVRMAYAAGDHSELPSLAPVEPESAQIARVSMTQRTDDESGVGRVGEGEDTMRMVSGRVGGRMPTVEAAAGREQCGARGCNESERDGRIRKDRAVWEKVRVLLLMVIGVLCGAVSCCVEQSAMAEVSVVHVFVVIEACVLGAEMVGGQKAESAGGMMGGMVGAVMRATQIAGVMRRVWEDFAVYMICVLGSVYFGKMV